MSHTVSTSTGRRYGLKRVCRFWKRPRSTVYHRRRVQAGDPATPRRRPGPQGPCDDATLLGHIRKVLADSPFHGEGYRKVWARLRFRKVSAPAAYPHSARWVRRPTAQPRPYPTLKRSNLSLRCGRPGL